MALFLIEHRHTEEHCPTHDPNMVRQLRDHVSTRNATAMGVTLLGDWVDEPNHHVVLIVETDTLGKAREFAAPFGMAGTVEVTMGFTCDQVARDCLGED